jgi:hypothetical protein
MGVIRGRKFVLLMPPSDSLEIGNSLKKIDSEENLHLLRISYTVLYCSLQKGDLLYLEDQCSLK